LLHSRAEATFKGAHSTDSTARHKGTNGLEPPEAGRRRQQYRSRAARPSAG